MGRFDGIDTLIAKHFGDTPPPDDQLTEMLEGAGYHVKGLAPGELAGILSTVDWTKLGPAMPSIDQQKRFEACGITIKDANAAPPAGTEADAADAEKWGDFTNYRLYLGTPEAFTKAADDLVGITDYEPADLVKVTQKLVKAIVTKADRPSMATCPNCDKKIPEGTDKCPDCGKKLSWKDGKPSVDDGDSEPDADDETTSKSIDDLVLVLKDGIPADKPFAAADVLTQAINVVKSLAGRHKTPEDEVGKAIHATAEAHGYNLCVPKVSLAGSDVLLLQKHVSDLSTDLAGLRVEKDGAISALTKATEKLQATEDERDTLTARTEELERQKAALLSELQTKSAALTEATDRATRLTVDPVQARKSVSIVTPGYRPEPVMGPTTMQGYLDEIRGKG